MAMGKKKKKRRGAAKRGRVSNLYTELAELAAYFMKWHNISTLTAIGRDGDYDISCEPDNAEIFENKDFTDLCECIVTYMAENDIEQLLYTLEDNGVRVRSKRVTEHPVVNGIHDELDAPPPCNVLSASAIADIKKTLCNM